MIDKRLLQLNSWIAGEQDLLDRGRQGASEPGAVEARAALSEFFKDLLARLPNVPRDEEAITASIRQAAPAGLQPLAESANPWVTEIMGDIKASLLNASDHDRPVADWLIASALFDALVSRRQPSNDGVNVAHLLASNSTRVRSFAEAVQASTPGDLDVVVSAMRTFIQDECSSPENHLPPGRRAALDSALEAWAAETDFGAVWDTRVWMGVELMSERLGMLTPLAAVKPTEFLALIEEVHPLPLQENCFFWRSIALDLDRVLEMLDKAPTVIDQQSGSWNRNVVAPLLLQTAFGVVRELGTHKQSNGASLAEDIELGGIAQTIIERALSRPDGVQLVSRWMQHQVSAAVSRAPDPKFEAVFNASLGAFAKAKITAADVYRSMTTEYPNGMAFPAQLSYDEANGAYEQLLLVAMLVKERVETGAGKRESAMRASLIELMRKARRPFAVGYGEVMPTWRHRIFADMYLAEVEPAKAWRKDLDFFAPERRGALHYSYFDDSSLMAPSLFLAGVGLSLIDLCLEADENLTLRQQGMAVWKMVFEASRPLFTHWSLSSDAWRNVAAALFARYPACLRTLSPSDLSEEQPVQWLALLGRDEGLVATALANLLNNEMDAGAICGTASAVEEMKQRMKDYLGWEGGAGSRALNKGVRAYLVKNFLGRTAATVAL